MRLSFANLFRAFVTLVLATHVFYMYSLGRGMDETFGVNWTSIATSAMFALTMLVPLVWAVTIPELPEIYLRHVRPRRWWKRDRCPNCGYPRAGLTAECCPECGMPFVQPQAYGITFQTVAMFVALNFGAWLIGCSAGETLMQLDEFRFRQQTKALVSSGAAPGYQRPRIWPNGNCAMFYSEEGGYRSVD